MKPCAARRELDEMVCNRCGLRWDVKDAERPACTPRTRSLSRIKTALDRAPKYKLR